MDRFFDLESKLEEGFQYIAELQRSLDGRLHDQRAFLTYNLTSFKTDIDGKIKRQQKNLQVLYSLIAKGGANACNCVNCAIASREAEMGAQRGRLSRAQEERGSRIRFSLHCMY